MKSSASHRLELQPQRPGEVTQQIYLDLERTECERIEGLAAGSGLPTELWLTVAIEAERALIACASVVDLRVAEVAAALDEAAETSERGDQKAQDHLGAYAEALRSAPERLAGSRVATMAVRPSLTVLKSWTRSAAEDGIPIRPWMEERARGTSSAREHWEAAAANEGRSLAEWELVQAARLSRRSMTEAQAVSTGLPLRRS